jgi:hypothetical protein
MELPSGTRLFCKYTGFKHLGEKINTKNEEHMRPTFCSTQYGTT